MMNDQGFNLEELNYIENYVDNQSKSSILTWLLWFFLGTFGAHRFYHGKMGSAISMLVLTALGYITTFILIGFVFLAIVWIWWVVDAFLLNGWIEENRSLTRQEAIDNVLQTRANQTTVIVEPDPVDYYEDDEF